MTGEWKWDEEDLENKGGETVLKTKVIKCKDKLKRQFILVEQNQVVTCWKCFGCGVYVWTLRKGYIEKKRYLAELEAHICREESL